MNNLAHWSRTLGSGDSPGPGGGWHPTSIRPLYHFSSPENYMNDPNGLCQWQGRYHMFYQFRPTGVDRVHWGHTVSDDLIHWRDLPPAIFPTTERDCFSGQTLVEDDRVVAIYHGTQSGTR